MEAALRPTMRYVEPKTGEQQARSILFRTREQFVKQRTEAVNALRSHLYEFGFTAPKGIGYLPRLGAVLEDTSSDLPPLAREICRELLDQIANLSGRINAMKKRIDAIAREVETSRRLQTMPGVGPISALAVETFAPPMEQFKRGRDFAAWLGLVPRQASTGGKQRLGKTSKMGQRDIRRLLVTGAMAVIRWALRRGAPGNPWLARLLERKPPMVGSGACGALAGAFGQNGVDLGRALRRRSGGLLARDLDDRVRRPAKSALQMKQCQRVVGEFRHQRGQGLFCRRIA